MVLFLVSDRTGASWDLHYAPMESSQEERSEGMAWCAERGSVKDENYSLQRLGAGLTTIYSAESSWFSCSLPNSA